MPQRDGTGPMGAGAMTGWGRGCCEGRFGANRRFRRFNRILTNQDEAALLEEEEKVLKEELAQVQKERAALKNK